ncbi:MAG: RAD55 family ATPase [Nitrososphaeria archaeon]|nr:ATPase domain-containing protein [Conexivisphaerales archaeon]
MSSRPYRTPLEILRTKNYVSVIEGDPGIGKTTLALASALESENVTYISYNEPKESLLSKAKNLIGKDLKNLEILRMLSGNQQVAFSEILASLEKGNIVILDSVNAFLWTESGANAGRALMQLVYEASKLRKGSLILISEGSQNELSTIKYIADAYIKLEKEEVLGLNARKITVIKDRDYPVSVYPFYYTFYNGLKLFEASYSFSIFYDLLKNKVKEWERPFSSSIINEPDITLYVMDSSVNASFSKMYRYWLAADYLAKKHSVVYLTRPDEDAFAVKEILKKMSISEEGLTVIGAKGNLEEDLLTISNFKNTIIIADLITWENEAISTPSEYEFTLKRLVETIVKRNSSTILFSYNNYTGLNAVKKYAARERWFFEKETHLFLRTLKPPGALYYVKLENTPEPELKLYMMT